MNITPEEIEQALESMVWQFAYRGVKDSKLALFTGGLSALEEAFSALGWDNPHVVEDTDSVPYTAEKGENS